MVQSNCVNFEAIKAHIRSLNKTDMQGVIDWIVHRGMWELRLVVVDELEIYGPYSTERAAYYAALSTPAPPIVVQLLKGRLCVVDGNHRASAAKLRGENTILAYVPCGLESEYLLLPNEVL